MDRIRQCAEVSVRRGLGFTALGVFSVMAGLAFDPPLATKAGAILLSLAACVMAWKAWNAPNRSYRMTEVYVMLDGRLGLPEEAAQRTVGRILRECYRRHAEMTAVFAASLWVLSLLLPIVGVRGTV